jgi:transketolase
MALHGAFLPYGATFLVFSDSMRPSIRLAALMGIRSVFVFTHDSVFLGEDGPTHQPIEQLGSLRMIPGLEVWRPADGPETAAAWSSALRRRGPTAIVLTRQKLDPLRRGPAAHGSDALAGGYVLEEADGGVPRAVLVATGSEVPLAQAAAAALKRRGTPVGVVSMPCVERFQALPAARRDRVLPPGTRIVVLEAARTDAWCAVVGGDALRIGLNRFGASAPAATNAREMGFTPDAVAARIAEWLDR